jgi:hypothetical protein
VRVAAQESTRLPSSLLRQHQRRHPDPIRENSCAAGPKGLESAAVHRPLPRPCIGMGCSRTALCGVVARHHRGLPMLAPRGVGFRYTRRRTNHGIRHVICRLSRRAIYCRRARNTDHTTTQPQPVDRATITHQIEAGAGTGDETARLTATIAVEYGASADHVFFRGTAGAPRPFQAGTPSPTNLCAGAVSGLGYQ